MFLPGKRDDQLEAADSSVIIQETMRKLKVTRRDYATRLRGTDPFFNDLNSDFEPRKLSALCAILDMYSHYH